MSFLSSNKNWTIY